MINIFMALDVVIFFSLLLGLEWHLRKTNWCGEMGEVLDDEVGVSYRHGNNVNHCLYIFQEARLEKLHIKSGDSFVVESGKLPPKV